MITGERSGWWLLEDGYERLLYDVIAEDDEIVICWPQGLYLVEVNPEPRRWKIDTVKVRPTPDGQINTSVKRYNREMRPEDGPAVGRMYQCGNCGQLTMDGDLHWDEQFKSICCRECHVIQMRLEKINEVRKNK